MNEATTGRTGRTGTAPGWRKFLFVVLFLGLVGGFVWNQLPSGAYPTDLSRIGAGRPALVLAHDANYVGGMEVMALLNVIRGDYAERVEFLVAHLGMQDAREFASLHAASDGTVLLFAGDGRRVSVLHQPRSVGELRQALAQAFGP